MAQVGLKDLHYAILNEDSKNTLQYEVPQSLAGIINATINPSVNTQELYADDQLWESVSALGKIDVEIETADLPLNIRAILGGHSVENGILIEKSGDIPPHIALGFKSLKSNGKYRYIWLLKGVAQPMAEDFSTKKDNVEHKTPKTKFTFMPRAYDGEWKHSADEDNPAFTAAQTWFDKVPGDESKIITILHQPIDITTTEGLITENLELEAMVTGGIELSYQWYSNTTNSTNGGSLITGAIEAEFTLPTDLSEGSYYYYCIISAPGALSVTSDLATVTVIGG